MNGLFFALRECGLLAWLCVLLFLPGLAAGIAALVLAARSPRSGWIAGIVAVVLGVAALGTSVLGREVLLAKVMAATSSDAVDPSQRERIRAVGRQEATGCLEVGAVTGGLPFALGAIAAALGFAGMKRTRA